MVAAAGPALTTERLPGGMASNCHRRTANAPSGKLSPCRSSALPWGVQSVFSWAWSMAFGDSLTNSLIPRCRWSATCLTWRLYPLVILWFGIGESAKLFLIVLGVFFPIYLNTTHGVRSVDPRLVEMGRSYGLSRLDLILKIVLPGALPSILVGVRYALGITWLTLIVAETIASDNGIGYMTMNARDFLQTDVMLLGILLYALLGKMADLLTRLLERYLLRWNPAYRTT